MTRKEFETSRDLLEDVMRKQAGSLEKAILEAVMNSVDANATTVEVTIEADRVVIRDNGEGMTEDEVDNYFRKFGFKDDDIEEKVYGKFRMGRGQIFNFGKNVWHSKDNILVVDLNNDTTMVEVEGENEVLDIEGLSYQILDSEETFNGCCIEVELYDNIGSDESATSEVSNKSVSEKVKKVKKHIEFISWTQDVEIVVNGVELNVKAEADAETEEAYYIFESEHDRFSGWTNDPKIYNMGAYVKKEDFLPIETYIVSKVDIGVNFARNDILNSSNHWSKIKKKAIELTEEKVAEKPRRNAKQRKWLLKRFSENPETLKKFKNVPVVEDIKGNVLSIEDISDSKVSFTTPTDQTAISLENSDVIFIQMSYQSYIEDIHDSDYVVEYGKAVGDNSPFEMSELDEDDLSKKRKQRIGKVRWFLDQLGYTGEIVVSYSKHKSMWKDEEGVIHIHKDELKKNKDEFLTETLETVIETAAHNGDSRKQMNHGMQFRRSYWNLSKNKAEPLKKLIKGKVEVDIEGK